MQLSKGDKLITSTGSKKTVLSVVDGLIALSAVNNPYKFDNWYTPEMIKKNGWEKEQEDPIDIEKFWTVSWATQEHINRYASFLIAHGYEVTKKEI